MKSGYGPAWTVKNKFIKFTEKRDKHAGVTVNI